MAMSIPPPAKAPAVISTLAPYLSITRPTNGDTKPVVIDDRVTAPIIAVLDQFRLSDMGFTNKARASMVAPTPTKNEKNPTVTIYHP